MHLPSLHAFLSSLEEASLSLEIDTMHRRFRRVLTVVQENCSVGYAQIVTVGGFCNVDLIVIKATAPNDSPLPEKYVQELLKIFAFSPPSFRAFSRSLFSRFRNTRCWRVGLKCLLLLHRLLQSSVPEISAFRVELLSCRATGLMSLHQHHIRDDENYVSFIRSYARLLDEVLNCDFFYYANAPADSGDEVNGTISSRINEINRVIEKLPQLQSLIDRVIDCWPAGKAMQSFAVRLAMKHILRESFSCYQIFCTEIVSVEDSLLQMPYPSCVAAIRIYKKAADQADRVSQLYDWCKLIGVCGLNEFPYVDRIPDARVQALESYVGRMWQLTESSSSSSNSTTSTSSLLDSPPSANDSPLNKVAAEQTNVVVSTEWETFEGNNFAVKQTRKEKPLIELDGWEDLLEASVSITCDPMNCDIKSHDWDQNPEGDTGKMQMYNPISPNPFHHDCFFPSLEIK